MKKFIWIIIFILFSPLYVSAGTCEVDPEDAYITPMNDLYRYDATTNTYIKDGYFSTINNENIYKVEYIEDNDLYKLCEKDNTYINSKGVITKNNVDHIKDMEWTSHEEDGYGGYKEVKKTRYKTIITVNPELYLYELPSLNSKKVTEEPIKINSIITTIKNYADFYYIEYDGKMGWIPELIDGIKPFGETQIFHNAIIFKGNEDAVEICQTPYGEDCVVKSIGSGDVFEIIYYYEVDEYNLFDTNIFYIKHKDTYGWVRYDLYDAELDDVSDEYLEDRRNTTVINLEPFFKKYGILIKLGIALIVLGVITFLLVRSKKHYVPEEKEKIQLQPFLNNNNEPISNVNIMNSNQSTPTPSVNTSNSQDVINDLMRAEEVEQSNENVQSKNKFLMKEEPKKEEETQEQQETLNAFTDFKPVDKK